VRAFLPGMETNRDAERAINVKLRRTPALVMAATAALLTLSACGSSQLVHDQKSFSLSGTRLVIDDSTSDLRLIPGSGSRFQVAVPPDVPVVVHSGSGNDTVSGLSGSVTIDGGAGTVQLSDTSGPLQVSTGSRQNRMLVLPAAWCTATVDGRGCSER
jgi:hypothetical protein